MATLTLDIYSHGTLQRQVKVVSPSSYAMWLDVYPTDNYLVIMGNSTQTIEVRMDFPSASVMNTFIADLIAYLDEVSGDITLSNLGPVATTTTSTSTTTTTSTSTTTTTTEVPIP